MFLSFFSIVGNAGSPWYHCGHWFIGVAKPNSSLADKTPVAVVDVYESPTSILCLLPHMLVEPAHGSAHDAPSQVLTFDGRYVEVAPLIQIEEERVDSLR